MKKPHQFHPKKIKKQIFIALLISISSFIIIFSFFSWQEIPNDFRVRKPIYLFIAMFILVIAWSIDAFRIYFTCKAWNKNIRLRDAFKTVLSGYFFGGITPANAGGSVAEIYVLKQAGLSWGEAGSLTTICGILYQISLILLFFFLFVGSSVNFVIRSRLMNLIYTFFLVYSIIIGIMFLVIQKPQLILFIVEKVMNRLKKRFPSFEETRKNILIWIETFIYEFKGGFYIFFIKKPQYLFFNLGMHILYFLAYFSVAYFILFALGIYSLHMEVIRIQIPIFFTFGIIPTPGASGGVELALTTTFASLLGSEQVGTFVFYWRVITYYITLTIGGLIFFRFLEKSSNKSEIIDTN